jgi:diaminopropionate ammonia-lyase
MNPGVRMIDNPAADAGADYGPAERSILSREAFDLAQREIRSWPGYRPTPLLELKGMAANCGIRRLFYKDEGHRFGLKSFKALGGAYAVLRALREHLGKAIDADGAAASLAKGGFREKTRTLTVAAATDGNHGRSVAWAAEMFGCECVIYLHEHVSKAREREIGRYGARIRRVAGNYDDSVRACIEEARNGMARDPGYIASRRVDAVACQVMQGYRC